MKQPDPLRVDFHLLDRQIVDLDGELIGKVDDVELGVEADGTLTVRALLVGLLVLGERVGGIVGRGLRALASNPHRPAIPLRVPYEVVDTVGSEITLTVRRDDLPDPPLEAWLRGHLIDRIPGADRESE
jgi:sporulation protein YlmC with PRC-barrel domain